MTEAQTRAYGERQLALDAAQGVMRRRLALSASLPSLQVTSLRTDLSGNIIDVGRFVNPAYGALNQLVGRPAFPTDLSLRLPLRSQQFVRVTQPLFAPAAWFGVRAATRAEEALGHGRRAMSRQAMLEIRQAWLGWYKVQQVAAAYAAARAVLMEQLRISERLVAEGVRTPEVVLQVRADLAEVGRAGDEAENLRIAAGRRLNLLVGRPLEVPVDGDELRPPSPLPPVDSLLRVALTTREELQQLTAVGRALDEERKAVSASFLPTVALAYDYGFQGPDAKWRGDREYRQLAVVAQWNLFNGFADRARVDLIQAQGRSTRLRREEAERQIEAQLRTAHDAARLAAFAVGSTAEQLTAAERAFTMVRRRFDEGLAVPVEVLDARRAVTAAAVARAASLADYHARRLDLLVAAAIDPGSLP